MSDLIMVKLSFKEKQSSFYLYLFNLFIRVLCIKIKLIKLEVEMFWVYLAASPP